MAIAEFSKFSDILSAAFLQHLLSGFEIAQLEFPEKARAPHSSILAWKMPWTEEPGRLQSMGSLEVGHDFTFIFHFHALEKEMATHSSILAWKMPWTEEPGGLQFTGVPKTWT